jgi:hypothetical protein
MEMLFILVVIIVFFVLPVAFLLLVTAGFVYSIFRALGGGKKAAQPVRSGSPVLQPHKPEASQESRVV